MGNTTPNRISGVHESHLPRRSRAHLTLPASLGHSDGADLTLALTWEITAPAAAMCAPSWGRSIGGYDCQVAQRSEGACRMEPARQGRDDGSEPQAPHRPR